jgi:2-aminoadipate transaminase
MTNRIINFTRGMPPSDVFPVDELVDCSRAALQRDPSVLLQYGRSPGYPPLCAWLAQEMGIGVDRVLTGNSSLELFAFVTQLLLPPGARAFVESPSYDRAIALLQRAGAQVVGIPLEPDGVDLAALEAELRRGVPALMYLIADFQNPSGVTTSLAKRQRLAELAREHGFWLVEDAPYRYLRLHGEPVPTLLSLAPERVLHLSSFSKVLAPGLRLGYLVGPSETVTQLAAWAVDTYIGPVLPTQGMVYEYCRRGLLKTNIARLCELYRPRLEAALAAAERHLPEAKGCRPDGGFFVGLTLPGPVRMDELLRRAAQVNLKLSDGRGFFPCPTDGENFIRIPFSSVTPEEIEDGVARLSLVL